MLLKSEKCTIQDVFHSYLVDGAEFTNELELPILKTNEVIPKKLIRFSDAFGTKNNDFNQFVHFYEHDSKYERLWNNPKAYLEKLKKFDGVITPDYSLYREMPLCMQQWNTYRSRSLGFWLSKNGVPIIPNVRWGDERTYDFCFGGVEKNSTVAIGTHGCIKKVEDKYYFKLGFKEMLNRLTPKTVLVFGKTPDDIFEEFYNSNFEIIQYESEFSLSREQVTA